MAAAGFAGRLHQWLLRSAAPRSRKTAGRRARGLRPPCGGIERRCLGYAAQRRGSAGAAGHGARRGAGRARSCRSRRRVRRGYPGKADRARKADGSGQRRRLHARAGSRPRDRRGARRRSDFDRHRARPLDQCYGRAHTRAESALVRRKVRHWRAAPSIMKRGW